MFAHKCCIQRAGVDRLGSCDQNRINEVAVSGAGLASVDVDGGVLVGDLIGDRVGPIGNATQSSDLDRLDRKSQLRVGSHGLLDDHIYSEYLEDSVPEVGSGSE